MKIDCETCLNSRGIISENGMHRICSLSEKTSMDCITGKKDRYLSCSRCGTCRYLKYKINVTDGIKGICECVDSDQWNIRVSGWRFGCRHYELRENNHEKQ